MKRIQEYIQDGSKESIAALSGRNPFEVFVRDFETERGVYDETPIINDIADYMAYMINFADRLRKNEPYATGRWRVMLCEAFYGSLFRKEVKSRYATGKANVIRVNLKEDTSFVKLMVEGLVKHDKITGLSQRPEALTFYKQGDTPYGLYLPGFIILPFANLDKSVFRLSGFYKQDPENPDSGKWDYSTVVEYFTENPRQVKYFLQYLIDLRQLSNSKYPAYRALDRYIEDICNTIPGARSLELQATPHIKSVEEVLKHDYAYYLTKEIGAGIENIVGASLFEENVLCFFETGEQMDNNGFVLADTALGRYRFDYMGQKLTPVGVKGLLGEPEDKTLYVVPPVTSVFFDSVMNETVTFKKWRAAVSPDKKEIDIYLTFEIAQVEFTHAVSFKLENILIAKHMPYISMWPYVDIDWHEFLVCVLPNEFTKDDSREKYAVLENVEKVRYIGVDELKIDIPQGGTGYDCSTVGIIKDSFKILHSDKFPDAITLSYEGIRLGYWVIDKSGAKKGYSVKEKSTAKIGFDFATTASVIKLFINENVEAVEGPGEYLYDIFNPNYGSLEKTEKWENIHNYTMLGSAAEALPKIYTYGQNNEVYRNGERIKQTRNFVTGRAVIVSPGFLLYSIVGRDSIANSKIFGNLKWPDDANDRIVITEKDEARDNFILNVLSWGLLKAKLLGCDNVDVNVSYPRLQLGGAILFSIDRIKGQLEKISGYNNIPINAFREAEANAAYLIDGFFSGFHKFPLPNPKNGFMIVDIGGGTTDVAVCQYDDTKKSFAEKIIGESSFKFAGRELIDIPLLMNEQIRNMWKPTTAVDINSILKEFNWEYAVNTRKPLPDSISRSISSIGFILDNTQIKNEYMLHATEKSRQVIKYKYVGLFWLLGRFLYRLEREGKIDMPKNGVFNIYLTGCASNGLQGLCAIDDDSFILKCNEAVYRGYCAGRKNISTRISIESNDSTKNSGVNIKEAVSLGLVLLKSENEQEEEPESFAELYNLEQLREEESQQVVDTFDYDDTINLFKDLLDTLKLVNKDTYDYDSLSDRDRAFIDECLTGVDEETEKLYRNFLHKKIGEGAITADFLALYTLEVFLDMRKNLYPGTEEESVSKDLEGELMVAVPVFERGMSASRHVSVNLKYETKYKVHFPEKFSIKLNGKHLTADDMREIEEEYRKQIREAIRKAMKKTEISYRSISEGTLDLSPAVKKELNDSVFSDAGFITDKITIETGSISDFDTERIRTDMLSCMGSVFRIALERRKADCVCYGKVTRILPRNIYLELPFVFEENGEIIKQIKEVFPVKLEYCIDDSEHYFSYRGINVLSDEFKNGVEKTFVETVVRKIVNLFDSRNKKGISTEQVRLIFNTETGVRNQIMVNDLFPDFNSIKREIARIEQVAGISLVSVELPKQKVASPDLLRFLEDYEKEKILRGAQELVKGNENNPDQLKLAINELSKIAGYSNSAQLINFYQEKIKEIERKQSVYDYALKTAEGEKSIKKLTKAIKYLSGISDFKDSKKLVAKYEEKIKFLRVRKKKRRKRIRRLIYLVLMLMIGYYLSQNLFICGANCVWNYSFDTGRLTVSGEGEMQSTDLRKPAFAILGNFAQEIVIEEGITSIDYGAFEDFTKVESVSLPATLKTISAYAFENCDALSEITIPDSVEFIGKSAFRSCAMLKNVNMPYKQIVVEEDGFAHCPKISFTATEETESNNSTYKADQITMNRFYTGNLYDWYEEEEDWYVLYVDQETTVQLFFYTKDLNDDSTYWDISVREANHSWSRDKSVWKAFVNGETTYTSGSSKEDENDDVIWDFTLYPGTYYIEIESSNEYSAEPYYFYILDKGVDG